MYCHINDIKTFVPFLKTTSVSTHFNLKHHDFNKHFSFFVLRENIDMKEMRLASESFLLNLCVLLGVNLINDHIPLINDYYKI